MRSSPRLLAALMLWALLPAKAFAADFDGGGGITGWMDASQTGNVSAGLRKRGYSEADIGKILGGNLLRTWQAVIDEAAREQAAAR